MFERIGEEAFQRWGIYLNVLITVAVCTWTAYVHMTGEPPW